jgi:hypothetical protein
VPDQGVEGVIGRHHRARDGRRAGTAVGLDHVAIEAQGALAEGFQVIDGDAYLWRIALELPKCYSTGISYLDSPSNTIYMPSVQFPTYKSVSWRRARNDKVIVIHHTI